MLDLLFTFVGGQGHAEPLLPLAHAARRAGHAVRFACRPRMVPYVVAAGFPVVGIGADEPEPTSITPLLAPDPQHEDDVLREAFAGQAARQRARLIRDLCAEQGPDVIVADEVDFGALVAAETMGVPYASVVVLAAGGFARPELLAEPIRVVRAEFGLVADPHLAMLSHAVVAPIPPSFRDPDHPLPLEALFVRPQTLEVVPNAAPIPSTWVMADRPHVYISLGTIFNMESGDLFHRLLGAAMQLEADVVVTTGRHLDPEMFGEQPAHVRVERYVPLADALSGCDLVICHGGSGTVVGALSRGVPVITLPMGADQPHNGRRCETLGVGRMLDPVVATPADIAHAALDMLGDHSFRDRAGALAREAAALPSPDVAVRLLERVAEVG